MSDDLISRDALIKHLNTTMYRDVMEEIKKFPATTPEKALMRFRHVIIIHPKYGECDGWYDEERHLLFHDFVTKEIADRYGWKIKEVEE